MQVGLNVGAGPASDPAITGIDLDVERGGTRVVLGPIHSGKSMVMRHVVGLERARAVIVKAQATFLDRLAEHSG